MWIILEPDFVCMSFVGLVDMPVHAIMLYWGVTVVSRVDLPKF